MVRNYDKTYLDGLIAKAKKSWEGVDVESYMSGLRDNSFYKEVAVLPKEVASYIKEQMKSNMDKATIKCRALMVGDWITDIHGFPMQITTVGDDYAYATFEGNEGDPWEYDDDTYPPYGIPITEEILKKNGFTWDVWGSNNIHATLLIKEKRVFIEWRAHSSYLAIWFDYDEHNDGVYADIVIPVKYLHELQQALRLAGMTDMANNFKI